MVYAYLQFFSFNLLLLFKPVDKTHNHAENIEDGLVRVVIVLNQCICEKNLKILKAMNEERTGKCLRQVEHICGYL
jgi:hypothetical protein